MSTISQSANQFTNQLTIGPPFPLFCSVLFILTHFITTHRNKKTDIHENTNQSESPPIHIISQQNSSLTHIPQDLTSENRQTAVFNSDAETDGDPPAYPLLPPGPTSHPSQMQAKCRKRKKIIREEEEDQNS